jgi:hypothetical protein
MLGLISRIKLISVALNALSATAAPCGWDLFVLTAEAS